MYGILIFNKFLSLLCVDYLINKLCRSNWNLLYMHIYASVCKYIGIYHFLHCIDNCTLQIEDLWQPYIRQDCQHHFNNGMCLCWVFLAYFDNSCTFHTILTIMMIYDQGSLMLYYKCFGVPVSAAIWQPTT